MLMVSGNVPTQLEGELAPVVSGGRQCKRTQPVASSVCWPADLLLHYFVRQCWPIGGNVFQQASSNAAITGSKELGEDGHHLLGQSEWVPGQLGRL